MMSSVLVTSGGLDDQWRQLPEWSLLLVFYTYGEATSQNLWSQYDRHFVGITRHNALS